MASDSNSLVLDPPSETEVSTDTSQAVPLMLVTAYQDDKQRMSDKSLPNLPSHRFRYSVWHDLPKLALSGDQLRAPRVRDGPPVKDEMFYKLRDENNKRVHHTLRGKERKDYQDKTENWENAEHANLSYQDLQHDYQKKNFLRVLRRLIRAKEIVLIEDSLTQLQSVNFNCVTHLNLTKNYIECFKHLPNMPFIKCLVLTLNVIKELDGLEKKLGKTKIEYLHLKGNPVVFVLNYRPRVFAALPSLHMLDDIPKQASDEEYFPDYNGEDQSEVEAKKSKYCTIM